MFSSIELAPRDEVRIFVETDARDVPELPGLDRDGLRFVVPREAPVEGFRRGNADGLAGVELTDGIFLLAFLFRGGQPPGCEDAADADDNGLLELTDAISIFQFLFLGSAPPPLPGPHTCGKDPTPDELGCQVFEVCS